jgi:hypothetical protein
MPRSAPRRDAAHEDWWAGAQVITLTGNRALRGFNGAARERFQALYPALRALR